MRIDNPKRGKISPTGKETWFPYYAGFSTQFAIELLTSAELDKDTCILDPWNGAGTTTTVAADLGFKSIGFDLNPVMIIAGKAKLLSAREKDSLLPLAMEIVAKAKNGTVEIKNDPLGMWLSTKSIETIRLLELGLKKLLVSGEVDNTSKSSFDKLSGLAAFFYIALFRTARTSIREFISSNPTWIKRPKQTDHKVDISSEFLIINFIDQVKTMASILSYNQVKGGNQPDISISVANSESLPLKSGLIDFVLTSPPYCTRIDYTIATYIELAVLGYTNNEIRNIRERMIGTSTVPQIAPSKKAIWGNTCNLFLNEVFAHPSKASKTYYYKNHLQYFNSLYLSAKEIARVMKPGGNCVIVAQDSYYKEVHNNLPVIISEMMTGLGMETIQRIDFPTSVIMSNMHPGINKYRNKTKAIESVLSFRKTKKQGDL